jgi:hypothetical protein
MELEMTKIEYKSNKKSQFIRVKYNLSNTIFKLTNESL